MNAIEKEISCPYCGELITILLDPSVVPQEYIEDCQVCCRPIEVLVAETHEGLLNVSVRTDAD